MSALLLSRHGETFIPTAIPNLLPEREYKGHLETVTFSCHGWLCHLHVFVHKREHSAKDFAKIVPA
ncbi:hypothetical protein BDD14_4676 [Edaphobacter modestus]|uniref:Uncharacterized protein n=1 Tax=Edaphobacter modestus TaxID=388466 RepID=A0A4Q7YYK1_9BACT|nr:hypothetical protein BDD14_4676 [Edaphobacter modestus]